MTGQPLASSEGTAAAAGSAAPAPVAWYIGRDGQQFGPISDTDFTQAWTSGQLQPTDLVWREGFAEWQAVATLPAPAAPSTPAPAPPPPPAPAAGPASAPRHAAHERAVPVSSPQPRLQPAPPRADGSRAPRPEKAKRSRTGRRISIGGILGVLFFAIMLSAAAFVVWTDPKLKSFVLSLVPSFGSGLDRVTATAPIGGFAKTVEATDQAMQKSRLWQVLKKYHGEWYAARLQEATAAAQSGKSDSEIANLMLQAVAKLRRQYAGDASSASVPRLTSIASLFVDNLVALKARGVDACYQYASSGEVAPVVVAQFQNSEMSPALQAQLVATFEAIEEGRRTPRVYPAPRPEDFDVLVEVLRARGWKDKELQLFSDSQALSQAPPEMVCRLVTEWFQSQLAVSQSDVQMRLLVDSLRPMVAG